MAQFSGKPYFQIPRPTRRKGHLNNETLTGDKTLVAKDSQFQALDPNGANRVCTLPAELDGLRYDIKNTSGANTVDVQNDAAGSIVVLAAGESATVVCDGTTWIAFQGV